MWDKIKGYFSDMKPARILLPLFVLGLLIFFAFEAKADTTVEVGIPVVSDKFATDGADLLLIERFDDRWALGLGLISSYTDKYDREVVKNMVVFGQRTVRGPGDGFWNDMMLGIGVSWFQNTTTINGSKVNFALSIEYNNNRKSIFPDIIVWRHFSNAGTVKPNTGSDFLNFGYYF